MNPKALKKILKLRFLLSKKSSRAFSGSYKSKFKGTGLTFSDFREYSVGDDFRSISWPLTAKIGKPYIKVFEEDRGQTFVLMIDVSASSAFGSENSKAEVIEQLASLIAFMAEKNQDLVSLLLFSDEVEHYVPAGKSRNHILRIIRDIQSIQPKSKKTNIDKACHYLQKILKKKSYIFLMSDFFIDDMQKSLRLLRQKHNVVGIVIEDALDTEIPSLGLVDLEDIETGQTALVDTSSYFFKKDYREQMKTQKNKRELIFKKIGMQYFYVETGKDIFKPFIRFIQKQRGIA